MTAMMFTRLDSMCARKRLICKKNNSHNFRFYGRYSNAEMMKRNTRREKN